MTLWHIAWNYLWNRKLTTFLTIVSVALGVALITSVLLLHYETEKRFVEEGQSFDVAVGAKGSTQQLVLSTVYFIGQPTGTIQYSDFERLQKEEEVLAAFPINMGDSYQGFRIVGTTREMLEFNWVNRVTEERRGTFDIDQGDYFAKPLEAVIGAAVAIESQLRIGDEFASMHGFADMGFSEHHDAKPYKVVGILKASATPNDRAIFVDYNSIYEVHDDEYGTPSLSGAESAPGANYKSGEEHSEVGEHAEEADHAAGEGHADEEHGHAHKQLTAALLVLESPAQRFEFKQRIINDYPNAVAAVPIDEIQQLYNQLLGTARQVMVYIGFLVMVISSISILIGLYLSIIQRKRDLAIMRALGATSGEIVGSVLIEAFWVTLLGILAGYASGLALTWGIGSFLASKIGFEVSVFRPTADMISAYSAILIMGMIAGILPAWQAYRTDIARDLAEL
ncbi:MAG: ABC transporter permease [Candidatus Hydrogenedentes bacterium]|nr:ABC transporter permease [Candidatus Hydrogenedentota bacterium]